LVSLGQFISTKCSLASKVNIELNNGNGWESLLPSLFSLRHLQYLRLDMDSLAKPDPNNMLFGGIPKHTRPNWSNLVYLNISSTSALHIQKALVERMFEVHDNIYIDRRSLIRYIGGA
jgi:hypothetical protein